MTKFDFVRFADDGSTWICLADTLWVITEAIDGATQEHDGVTVYLKGGSAIHVRGELAEQTKKALIRLNIEASRGTA
jgi:hypothetical protein